MVRVRAAGLSASWGMVYVYTAGIGAVMTAARIVVDSNQDLAGHPGVITKLLRRPGARSEYADYDLVSTSGLRILVQEKKVKDLESSWKSRRLQSQLRTMLKENPDGVNVLGLRASGSVPSIQEMLWLDLRDEILIDLMKWQALGGYVGFLPSGAERVLETLITWRSVLQPTQSLFTVIAGSPKRLLPDDLTPVEKALVGLGAGIGPVAAKKLTAKLGQSLRSILVVKEEAWRAAGLNSSQAERLSRLVT